MGVKETEQRGRIDRGEQQFKKPSLGRAGVQGTKQAGTSETIPREKEKSHNNRKLMRG